MSRDHDELCPARRPDDGWGEWDVPGDCLCDFIESIRANERERIKFSLAAMRP